MPPGFGCFGFEWGMCEVRTGRTKQCILFPPLNLITTGCVLFFLLLSRARACGAIFSFLCLGNHTDFLLHFGFQVFFELPRGRLAVAVPSVPGAPRGQRSSRSWSTAGRSSPSPMPRDGWRRWGSWRKRTVIVKCPATPPMHNYRPWYS